MQYLSARRVKWEVELTFFPFFDQKMEDKLEEVLREFKSLRDRVILQDRRIARLEEQVAKVAMWRRRLLPRIVHHFGKNQNGGGSAKILTRFGFIELGVVPATTPGRHSKTNFIFFLIKFHSTPLHTEKKEKLSQQLMYTFEEKDIFVEGKKS